MSRKCTNYARILNELILCYETAQNKKITQTANRIKKTSKEKILCYLLGLSIPYSHMKESPDMEEICSFIENYDFSKLYSIPKNADSISKHLKNTLYQLTHNGVYNYEMPEDMSNSIDIFAFETEIYKVYLKYKDNETTSQPPLNRMIQTLVYFYVWHTDKPQNLFKNYKIEVSQYHVIWREAETQINTILSKNNIVILSGQAGCGKTQLAKSYIKNYIHPLHQNIFDSEVGWVYQEHQGLENAINNIEYAYEVPEKDKISSLQRLKSKPSSSLLVIELPVLTQKDMKFIDDELSRM